tara:strand:+ start:1233 stop:1808 length:576 start_codon:yes stop_codon:yes gene_type:complete
MTLDRCLNYLIRDHNIVNIIDPNVGIPQLYLPKFNFSDESYFYKILINSNNCIIGFSTKGKAFIANKCDLEKVPYFEKLLNGTGLINPDYKNFNMSSKKFTDKKTLEEKCCGCKLLNVKLDFFVYDDVFDLIPLIIKYVNDEGDLYRNLIDSMILNNLSYSIKGNLPENILNSQINNMCNIFGITIIDEGE